MNTWIPKKFYFYSASLSRLLFPSFCNIFYEIKTKLRDILKNKQKEKYVCIHEIIQLTIMKTKIKMKIKSNRHHTNRPRSRNKYKYIKYKKCFTMMMLICIKQHLCNIWGSIHEKVKQHWGWVEKKLLLIKKTCISLSRILWPHR